MSEGPGLAIPNKQTDKQTQADTLHAVCWCLLIRVEEGLTKRKCRELTRTLNWTLKTCYFVQKEALLGAEEM